MAERESSRLEFSAIRYWKTSFGYWRSASNREPTMMPLSSTQSRLPVCTYQPLRKMHMRVSKSFTLQWKYSSTGR